MRRFLLFLVLAGLATAATAQLRTIPKDAKLGKLRHLQAMVVEIDGKPRNLAPGAQIRDASNRIILPTAIPAGARVKYQLDGQGMVRRAWVLTAEEAKQ
jgi:hypothetical protein